MMHVHTRTRLAFAAMLIAGLAVFGGAASAAEYKPVVGQEGKDVIWVPTPEALVERKLNMAGLKKNEVHFDLGSGDGRTVIMAAKKFGARATGVEFNADMVELSRKSAEKEGVSARAQFIRGDIFQTDFTGADVVTLYLLPSLNLKLRPTILDMKPGTRVVSHAFTMGDWQADQVDTVEGRTAYMWTVPAKVEGTWRIESSDISARSIELTLRQQFQNIEGLVKIDDKTSQFRNPRLAGDRIMFSVIEVTGPASTVRRDFVGRVNGNRMEGSFKTGEAAETKWTATRAQ